MKYITVREAESELHKFLHDVKVKPFSGQKRTEWFRLKTQKQIKQTLAKMKEIADRTGGKMSYFGESHAIKLPE